MLKSSILFSRFRHYFHVKYNTLYFTFVKVCAVCGNLQLAWATFVCPNGTLVPNPRQEKKTSPSFLILVFSKATQSRKAPPAISLRLFQRDHFVETAPQGACQQDCLLGKSKRGTLSFHHSFYFLPTLIFLPI